MITRPVPNTPDFVLGRRNMIQTNTTHKASKQMPPVFIASVSHEDTCMILQSIDGILRLVLMWGTNTPENADNPDEGAFIDHAYGITCEELDARAFDEPYLLRQGTNWELEAEVCDVFAEFVFTPDRGEPVTLSVALDILRILEGVMK